MNGDKFYIKLVAFDEIYKFVVQFLNYKVVDLVESYKVYFHPVHIKGCDFLKQTYPKRYGSRRW
jgi:hypothetical protein